MKKLIELVRSGLDRFRAMKMNVVAEGYLAELIEKAIPEMKEAIEILFHLEPEILVNRSAIKAGLESNLAAFELLYSLAETDVEFAARHAIESGITTSEMILELLGEPVKTPVNTRDFFRIAKMKGGANILVVDDGDLRGVKQMRLFNLIAYRDGKIIKGAAPVPYSKVGEFVEKDFQRVAELFHERIINDSRGGNSSDALDEILSIFKSARV